MFSIEKTDNFEKIFKMYCHDLVKFAYYYLSDINIAEDIVQDVFLIVWKNRSKFKSHDHLRSYLYKVTKNSALMVLRKNNVRQRYKNEHSEQFSKSPADIFYENDLDKAYHNAINALPKNCRIIFCMNRFDGLTYKEIAKTLGISIKTVETQIGRALVSLRKQLYIYYH